MNGIANTVFSPLTSREPSRIRRRATGAAPHHPTQRATLFNGSRRIRSRATDGIATDKTTK
jgi:hypothetical protein